LFFSGDSVQFCATRPKLQFHPLRNSICAAAPKIHCGLSASISFQFFGTKTDAIRRCFIVVLTRHDVKRLAPVLNSVSRAVATTYTADYLLCAFFCPRHLNLARFDGEFCQFWCVSRQLTFTRPVIGPSLPRGIFVALNVASSACGAVTCFRHGFIRISR
jgi:hypothetical protein